MQAQDVTPIDNFIVYLIDNMSYNSESEILTIEHYKILQQYVLTTAQTIPNCNLSIVTAKLH